MGYVIVIVIMGYFYLFFVENNEFNPLWNKAVT